MCRGILLAKSKNASMPMVVAALANPRNREDAVLSNGIVSEYRKNIEKPITYPTATTMAVHESKHALK